MAALLSPWYRWVEIVVPQSTPKGLLVRFIIDGKLDDPIILYLRMYLSDESCKRIDARHRDAAVVRRYLIGGFILEVPCARKLETNC